MAMLRMRLIPNAVNSSTCWAAVSSGPRKRKLGKIVETVKVGSGSSSVVGGWSRSGRAVTGDGGKPTGVMGVRGLGKGARELVDERLSDEPLTARRYKRVDGPAFLFEWVSLRCEGEFARSDDEDDCRLRQGAARVFDFEGAVRSVSFGTSLSADVVSSLRRFGILDVLRVLVGRGKTDEEGDGEGDNS